MPSLSAYPGLSQARAVTAKNRESAGNGRKVRASTVRRQKMLRDARMAGLVKRQRGMDRFGG